MKLKHERNSGLYITKPCDLAPQASSFARVLQRHVTEILFKSKIPHKEENKLPPNSKIRETDHWFHLESVRNFLHVITVENFVLDTATKFFREGKSYIYILETAEIMQHSSSAKFDFGQQSG